MKTVYSRKERETSLIPNSIIERLFMSVCDDEQMRVYMEKANSSNSAIRASATAYASSKVERVFMYWRDTYIKSGGNLEFLQFSLWKRTKMEL